MIRGVGIDAVRISRLEKWAADPKLLERFFHPGEVQFCRDQGRGMLQSLAARFAAKEAFGKALGTGLAGFAARDIMVEGGGSSGGPPLLRAFGSALEIIREKGLERTHVSLTHEGDIAIALVVLEGE